MLKIYLELAKYRLSLLVALTAVVGFVVAGGTGAGRLAAVAFGTLLAAFGANAVNQRQEAVLDALMARTRGRPIPSGRIGARHALVWGVAAAALGCGLLVWRVNALAGGLAAGVVLLYTLVYTPLKTRSTFCTLVGAVCGAVPPLIGCAGGAGRIDLSGWLLAATLFVWQIPHFFALGWLYRDDYARGGFRMLPVVDRTGALTSRLLVAYSALLLPLGLLFAVTGLTGLFFAAVSVALGVTLTALGIRLWRDRSDRSARRVFLASLAYLAILLAVMVVDRGGRGP
jgi:protoheme IX farnesyltransferase